MQMIRHHSSQDVIDIQKRLIDRNKQDKNKASFVYPYDSDDLYSKSAAKYTNDNHYKNNYHQKK